MKTIQVSDETYEKIKDQIGADKEFKPIKDDKIEIGLRSTFHCSVPIYLSLDNPYNDDERKEVYEVLTASGAGRIITALQSAIDFVEKNK